MALIVFYQTEYVIYAYEGDGSDLMILGYDGEEDLQIGRAWKQFGAEFRENRRSSLRILDIYNRSYLSTHNS